MNSIEVPSTSHLAPIWRADRLDAKGLSTGHPTGHPTGFDALDAQLPDRGWPRAGLVEILRPQQAGAEWSLLTPWLRRVGPDAGQILCLAPPHDPFAPALQQLGLPIDRLLLVRAGTAADAAWAGEQAAQLMACNAILWWVSANIRDVTPLMLRRLHLAGTVHPTPVFVFGPAHTRRQSSPAPLRLLLEQAGPKLAVTVIKRRGPPMIQPIELDLPTLDSATQIRWKALARAAFQKRPQPTRVSSKPTPDVDRTAAVASECASECASDCTAQVPAKVPAQHDHGLACPAPAGLAA